MSQKFLLSAVFGLAFVVPSPLIHGAELPKGDVLTVQIERDSHMKMGESVRARTVYPLYVNNQLVIPAGSEVSGTITALDPAPRKTRKNAKLGGDFTPLHTAEIEFDRLVFADGTDLPIRALPSAGGVEVVRFQALSPSAKQPSLAKRLWAEAVGREKDTVHSFTAPGKSDRLRRALYAELPYHPELLTQGTQFAVQLASPLDIDSQAGIEKRAAPEKAVDSTVTLAAELMNDISSKDAVQGTKVSAIVTEPLFNKDQLQVPQGTVLRGEITQAHAAGKWGKGGVLRFSFREMQFPEGFMQKVHGAPVAVDAAQNSSIQLDAEGGAKPASKGVGAPLIMGLLAVSALHEDEASVLSTSGASNGFALIGRVAALAAKSQYVGAAFGMYGTGRAVYSRWIARGEDVSFPKHTRIEVALDPERLNTLKPPAK
jgi:hypothetical protein